MSSKFNSVRIILRQFVPSLYFPREEESFDDFWIRSNRKKEKIERYYSTPTRIRSFYGIFSIKINKWMIRRFQLVNPLLHPLEWKFSCGKLIIEK